MKGTNKYLGINGFIYTMTAEKHAAMAHPENFTLVKEAPVAAAVKATIKTKKAPTVKVKKAAAKPKKKATKTKTKG